MSKKPSIYTAIELEDPITLDMDRVFDMLLDGEIDMEHGMMRWGSNYTFLVNVTCDEHKIMAVYKPRVGERPLWDFPDGTLCQRETASFVISDMLNWHVVPPTVLREGPRGIGSVQAFINHDPEEHYFTFREKDNYPALQEQIQKVALFDAIINNADRKGGHCLIDEADKIWGIDHGLAFHAAYKLRTVIWEFAGQPIREDLVDDVQALCARLDDSSDTHTQQLRELISYHEIAAIKRRIQDLLKIGEYPLKGRGPNVPWPAI